MTQPDHVETDHIRPEVIREHFPDRPEGYFDHAAVGPVPAAVVRAVRDVAQELSRGVLGSAGWRRHTDGALDALALELGVATDRLGVLANTSTAMNLAARSIALPRGARVVTFADDFPSPRMPWPGIDAAVLTEIDPGADRTERLIEAIDDRVHVVSVTHVHASTGEVLYLPRVHAACRAAGTLLLVDGAQAAGLIPGAAAHADVYVAPTYKWLLAGFGGAVTATSARFDEASDPAFRGYRNPAPSHRLEVGHDNLFILAALRAATQVRHAIGVESIRRHTRAAVERIAAGAAEAGFTPQPSSGGAGIISLRSADATTLQRHLAAEGFSTAVRDGLVRISPYAITSHDDVTRLLTSLEKAAPRNRPTGGDR